TRAWRQWPSPHCHGEDFHPVRRPRRAYRGPGETKGDHEEVVRTDGAAGRRDDRSPDADDRLSAVGRWWRRRGDDGADGEGGPAAHRGGGLGGPPHGG